MQLYAKRALQTSPKGPGDPFVSDLISAEQAKRQCDYFCPECGSLVRLRAGEQRLKHFYHLAKSAHCRQQNKSLEHIQTQRLIQERIGAKRCRLEVAFPAINRIADVVWEEEKLIFEVQCSPMTASEARARICDYGSAGYLVVFILHDKRFNQHRLSALEAALRGSAYYFSDISVHGVGMVYDQFDQIARGCRIKRFGKLPISMDRPVRLGRLEKGLEDTHEHEQLGGLRELGVAFHTLLQERLESEVYFQGDLLSLASEEPTSCYVEEALQAIKTANNACKQARENGLNNNEGTRLSERFYVGVQFGMQWSKKMATHLLRLFWRHLLEKCGSR